MLDPVVERFQQAPRKRQRRPGRPALRCIAQHARDLDGVERVSSRRLSDPGENGARWDVIEVNTKDVVKGIESERPNVEDVECVGRDGIARRLRDGGLTGALTHAEHQADVIAGNEAPRRERQHTLGRSVEPLGVIHRNEKRLITRQQPERRSEARGNRVLVNSPTGRACTTRCDPKSARLWLYELGRNVIEERGDEIRHRRERETRLCLRRPRRQHADPSFGRCIADASPDGGLSHTRLTAENKRAGTRSEPVEEAGQLGHLRTTSDELVGHVEHSRHRIPR